MKSDNTLLSELLKRGVAPLMPASEEDQIKINTFKKYWKSFNTLELELLFRSAHEAKSRKLGTKIMETA
ncbi:MAG: hypothetical protein AAF519_01630 [Bacteroidota bacterium]